MMEAKVITATGGHWKLTDEHRCPNCGGAMAEIDRVNEDGFSFVWYECKQADCNGQWLEKKTGQTT